MIKNFIVESTYNNMRLDRWLRNKIGKIPQSLIEKSLRSGKIKINKKKRGVLTILKLVIKLKYLILLLRKKYIKKKLDLMHLMK